jgi:hypothetical protein
MTSRIDNYDVRDIITKMVDALKDKKKTPSQVYF